VKHISWQELRDVCKLAGCVETRTKGDHLVMTKPGLARPVIIKMDKDLGEDLIRSNMRTLNLSRKEFEQLPRVVRGHDRK
jgi:predicted RNA binding protein YcfA (HicA-like mRNA interferase family)